MIIAKLVLFASPIIIACMMSLANPAAASVVYSESATTHINSVHSQPVHKFLSLNQVDNSNPILEHLGCYCVYCVKPESLLQGQLPFTNI